MGTVRTAAYLANTACQAYDAAVTAADLRWEQRDQTFHKPGSEAERDLRHSIFEAQQIAREEADAELVPEGLRIWDGWRGPDFVYDLIPLDAQVEA